LRFFKATFRLFRLTIALRNEQLQVLSSIDIVEIVLDLRRFREIGAECDVMNLRALTKIHSCCRQQFIWAASKQETLTYSMIIEFHIVFRLLAYNSDAKTQF
jgi:hypothetical protein